MLPTQDIIIHTLFEVPVLHTLIHDNRAMASVLLSDNLQNVHITIDL